MHIKRITFSSAVLAVFLFLAAAGCGKSEDAEQEAFADIDLEIAESPPVLGWLDVTLPGDPVAMDAMGDNIWILVDGGIVMNWNTDTGQWAALDCEGSQGIPGAFDIAATAQGTAVLTPEAVTVLAGDQMATTEFEESQIPVDICRTDGSIAVLLQDGSVYNVSDQELLSLAEPAGKDAAGFLCHESGVLAWLNTDGTASMLDISESLVTEILLPEGTLAIDLSDGVVIAMNGVSLQKYTGPDSWETSEGTLARNGLVYRVEGICEVTGGNSVTAGLPESPEDICMLSDGTVWSMSLNSVAVWGEIGSVETRLPDADVQRLTCRMAGQTSGGNGTGDGIVTADASFGGVFRSYESVSSRPDPFTEFPAASRDLRRALEDITIEELHLVGITIDPSGGDQAMVEDANGVAYILNEGTTLRNNTRIAEITGNEVIVVQEVTVGSEDEPGGITSIPTIFSMRLHEEGGL